MRAGGRRGGGDVAGAGAVDLGRDALGGLGAVDVDERRAVDDRVRPVLGHGRARGGGVGDVDLGEVEADGLVAGGPGRGEEVGAEHAGGTDDEEAHGTNQ